MNDFATNLAFALAMLVAPPDLHLAWTAPTEATPDHYEIQVATNLAQFNQPVRGVFQFSGQTVYTAETNLGIVIGEVPQRFYRVRGWYGIECSDWATVSEQIP